MVHGAPPLAVMPNIRDGDSFNQEVSEITHEKRKPGTPLSMFNLVKKMKKVKINETKTAMRNPSEKGEAIMISSAGRLNPLVGVAGKD